MAFLYSKDDHKQNPPETVGEGYKRVKKRASARQEKS